MAYRPNPLHHSLRTIRMTERDPHAVDRFINDPQSEQPQQETAQMAKPLAIMVGADKGGVGKTTLSRVLSDWLRVKHAAAQAFDTEFPNGDLKRFEPAATIIDVSKVQDQMKMFDTIEGVTLVDIRAGLMSPTLRACDEVKMLDDVRAGKMNLALLHVLGPTITSFKEIADAAALIGGGARHFIVKNYSNGTEYFEWDTDPRFKPIFDQAKDRTIIVPELKRVAAERVELVGRSFVDFADSASESRTLRGYVKTWIERVWPEFDRVGLGGLVQEAMQ